MEPSPDQIAAAAASATGAPAPTAAPVHIPLDSRMASCPEHGPYRSSGVRYTIGKGREVWTPCPDCTSARQAAENEALEDERRAREKVRLDDMLGRAAIPVRFIGRNFDNYRADTPAQRNAVDIAREYATNFDTYFRTGESLLFLGKAGTGKSHLASAVLQAIMPRYCGMYTTAAEAIDMVRETWRRDSERSQVKVMNTLATVPLLVIDEIGVQYGTESEQNTLFQVIDRRYRDRRPMIIMANLQVAELQQVLGDRVYDRLREVSRVVKFDWDSFRPQARREA